ncbi:MAG TPA: hypothetical protein VK982_00345 [Bacteroidales bacterium]|nr:hypothetical protein [Bacteroidales bacterium]
MKDTIIGNYIIIHGADSRYRVHDLSNRKIIAFFYKKEHAFIFVNAL